MLLMFGFYSKMKFQNYPILKMLFTFGFYSKMKFQDYLFLKLCCFGLQRRKIDTHSNNCNEILSQDEEIIELIQQIKSKSVPGAPPRITLNREGFEEGLRFHPDVIKAKNFIIYDLL